MSPDTPPHPTSRPPGPGHTRSWRRLVARLWSRRIGIAGAVAVLVFAAIVARFWHPYYGMTRLLQLDTAFAARAIPELREAPVFVYREHGGYDGLFYAQLAHHPLLDSPDLERALDNPGFRARRILLSMTAWLLAGGRAAWITDIFAWLNIAAWLALAALLWRLLDVRDVRAWLAWAGVLFSAGAMHSVRQSLTDLPMLLLVAGAMLALERGRTGRGAGLLAAAALTRETGLLALAGAGGADWLRPRAWPRLALLGVAAALPLALWLVWVRMRFGAGDAGTGNFTWPLAGWLAKWPEVMREYGHPAFRRLVTTTLLATVAVSVQVAFFIVYRRYRDGWWRLGAVHVVLALLLGRAVWEGHPGSFTRVLLPLSLAFAVCAVRWRVPVAWLVAGGLSVFAALEPWRTVVVHPDDLASGRVAGRGYLVALEDGWFTREARSTPARAWSAGAGTVGFHFTATHEATTLQVSLEVRGIGPRSLQISDGQGEVWRGSIDAAWRSLTFPIRSDGSGHWRLDFASAEPPVAETDTPGARELAFALRAVRLTTAH